MIDLHSHVLPDVDDGAPDWETSLAMLALAEQGGSEIILATPHGWGRWRHPEPPRTLIPTLVEEANARASEAGLAIRVLPGHECMIDPEVERRLRAGDLLTLGGSRTVLLELPFDTWPPALDATIFALELAGYSVLLAHPERYRAITEEPNRLLPLVERGVMMQVTSTSITGRFGERVQAVARQFIEHGMAHVVASDAHSAGGRNPNMREAWEQVVAWTDEATAQRLFKANPRAILDDEAVPFSDPQPIKAKRRLFGLF